MLTEAEVRAMLARAEAASPGPWEEQRHDDETCAAVYVIAAPVVPSSKASERRRGDLHKVTAVCCTSCNGEECPQVTQADADFIAAARSDVPALAREVLALRGSLRWALGYMEMSGGNASYLAALPDSEDGRALLRAEKLLEQDARGGSAVW